MTAACRGALLLATCLAAGCGSAVRWDEPGTGKTSTGARTLPAVHVVQAGETLYSIAARYGVDVKDLARWNDLGDGSTIRVGQRLLLAPPPGSTSARAAALGVILPPRWQWPTSGPVVEAYGQSRATQSGIEIGGVLSQPVVAAADGQVVYAGNGLAGYGELLIIKHNETWLTAYGHNEALLVQEGDRVTAGQPVARMGEGPGQKPGLHFEIRRNGEPVNPAAQLPSR